MDGKDVIDSMPVGLRDCEPPTITKRWGTTIAGLVGVLALLSVFAIMLEGKFETRAHAEQTAAKLATEVDQKAAAISNASTKGQVELQTSVDALEVRVVRLEEGSKWTLYLLQQMAAKQGVMPPPIPPDLLPDPGLPAPSPAPAPVRTP
jgi:hypothetical protein